MGKLKKIVTVTFLLAAACTFAACGSKKEKNKIKASAESSDNRMGEVEHIDYENDYAFIEYTGSRYQDEKNRDDSVIELLFSVKNTSDKPVVFDDMCELSLVQSGEELPWLDREAAKENARFLNIEDETGAGESGDKEIYIQSDEAMQPGEKGTVIVVYRLKNIFDTIDVKIVDKTMSNGFYQEEKIYLV